MASHRVRPTSGIEFMSSRHFPDEVQGDLMINNSIGFRGTKAHKVVEEGTGYKTTWRHDLTNSTDGNYRPVDHDGGVRQILSGRSPRIAGGSAASY